MHAQHPFRQRNLPNLEAVPPPLTPEPLRPAPPAVVACRQLGFSGGEPERWSGGGGGGSVTNVRCSGNETSLIECDMEFGQRVREPEAAGVKCWETKSERPAVAALQIAG